jgi:hypothetical protein
MTREDFLSNPIVHFNEQTEDFPNEWIRTAWETNEDFREDIRYELRREIRKNGELTRVFPLVRIIAAALAPEQIVQLFTDLGGGGRDPREPEWRHQFEACVPHCVHLLPLIPPDVLRVRYAEYIATAIQHDMDWWLPQLLADYRVRGGDVLRLGRAKALTPTSKLGGFEIATPDAPGGFTLVRLARELGRKSIAEALLAAGVPE